MLLLQHMNGLALNKMLPFHAPLVSLSDFLGSPLQPAYGQPHQTKLHAAPHKLQVCAAAVQGKCPHWAPPAVHQRTLKVAFTRLCFRPPQSSGLYPFLQKNDEHRNRASGSETGFSFRVMARNISVLPWSGSQTDLSQALPPAKVLHLGSCQ